MKGLDELKDLPQKQAFEYLRKVYEAGETDFEAALAMAEARGAYQVEKKTTESLKEADALDYTRINVVIDLIGFAAITLSFASLIWIAITVQQVLNNLK